MLVKFATFSNPHTLWGWKDIWIRKFEFVEKTPFLCLKIKCSNDNDNNGILPK